MLLESHEVELFFRLHRELMFFVNQRLKVIPNKVATPEEFAALSPEVRFKVREAFNDNLGLIVFLSPIERIAHINMQLRTHCVAFFGAV